MKRENSFDIAKGFVMLLVILGHMGVSWVATFHMSFFFLVSGYFLNTTYSKKVFCLRKVRQLLLPYIFGCFLTMIGSILINILSNEFSEIVPDLKLWLAASIYGKGTAKEILIPGVHKIGALWFLLASFYGSIIARYCIEAKYNGIFYAALIAYIGISTRNIVFLPFSIQNGMVASFFIVLGVFLKNYMPTKSFKAECKAGFLLGCLLLWGFAIFYGVTLSMVNLRFPYGLLNILVALSATYSVIKFAQFLDNKAFVLKRIFMFYGRNSLYIFVFHALEINLIKWTWIYKLCQSYHFSVLAPSLEFLSRLLLCTLGTVVWLCILNWLKSFSSLLVKLFLK